MRKLLILLFSINIIYINNIYAQQDCEGNTSGTSLISANDKIEYKIWYKTNVNPGNSTYNKLTRPFIVVEGFDPLGTQDVDFVYGQVNSGKTRYLNSIRTQGYDIVVVDLKQNSQSIIFNAIGFIDFLENHIQPLLATNGSKSRSKVLGVSMGGLIARYALAKMEADGKDHKVDMYISFDSPHQGANVPVGLQYMPDYLNILVSSATGGLVPPASIAIPMLAGILTPSALEMAMNYYQPINPHRLNLLTNFALVGQYPNKCRKVGIAHGADVFKQDVINPGQELVTWEGGTCIFNACGDNNGNTICVQWCPLSVDMKVYATPGAILPTSIFTPPGTIFQGKIDIQVGPTIFDIGSIPVINNVNLMRPDWRDADAAPGSYYDYNSIADFINNTNNQFAITQLGQTQNVTLAGLLGYMNMESRMCFIPTTSALDIITPNFYEPLRSLPSYPYLHNTSITPFDAIHCINKNKVRGKLFEDGFSIPVMNHAFHAKMPNGTTADFMMEEVAPRNMYIQNQNFPSGYTNQFQASGNVYFGNNIDPVPNRSKPGDVTLNPGVDIDVSFNNNGGSVILGNGFNTNGGNFQTFPQDFFIGQDNCTDYINPNNTALGRFNILTYDEDPVAWSPGNFRKGLSVDDQNYINNNSSNYDISVEENNKVTELDLYPNPAYSENSKIEVNLANDQEVTLVLNDLSGKEVLTVVKSKILSAGKYTFDLNLTSLKNGLYIANLYTSEKSYSKKFILQR